MIRRIKKIGGGSVRARMTLLYGGLFTFITSAVLILVQQLQLRFLTQKVHDIPLGATTPCDQGSSATACSSIPYSSQPATGALDGRDDLQQSLVNSQRTTTLIAIALIAALAFAVCWWLTGRLLRPLHRIADTARRLSLSTL